MRKLKSQNRLIYRQLLLIQNCDIIAITMQKKPNWLVLKQDILNMDLSQDITDIVYAFDLFKGVNHFYIFFGKKFDISSMEDIKSMIESCDQNHKSNFVFYSCALKEEEIKRLKEMYDEIHLLR